MKTTIVPTLLVGLLLMTGCSSTRDTAGDLAEGAGDVAVDVGEGIGDAAGDVVDGAADVAQEVGEGVGEVATDAADGVADAADGVGDVVHQAVHGAESEDDPLLEGDNVPPVDGQEATVIEGAEPPPMADGTDPLLEGAPETPAEVVTPDEEGAPLATSSFTATDITWADGSDATGSITFEPMGDHYMLRSEFEGLRNGDYTFRVHEGTSCETPGGAYVPMGEHGYTLSESEMGWGNFTVEDGAGTFEGADYGLAMYGRHNLADHAAIIYDSNGNRVGCTIIGAE